MHSPCFLPVFEKNFRLRKMFTILPFPKIFFHFHPFFSHRPQISNSPYFLNSPYFPSFSTFPSLFRENYYFPPTFTNFPPVFEKLTCFLYTLMCSSFPPYFDHDAFMHHTMHVLDAPVYRIPSGVAGGAGGRAPPGVKVGGRQNE